ncbi:uncharacterized protein K452DRAFT_353972 [Aplosporella prunicola CBS 121167]|uniref:FAD-binding PCMH-type domain-containing protein n=1 Tax=Aplosporella prunicola CBS 121167 TaxID=1176127 RepID=A0A6A6B0X7_9PEZI|nr:uncharacterized protein K452DRAFT_353972 [Aplosporella prunicola CBS 121167]KAF2136381.1 hypothetical protein K452DRAFT_353972 [Aplosporella prunicola CBS 121167]
MKPQTVLVPLLAVLCQAIETARCSSNIHYPGDSVYENRLESYFSEIAKLRPQCLVQPVNTDEVASIVKTLVRANKTSPCHFAIRSGGHTPWAGASNIEDGVTVDLGFMNATTYSQETNLAHVQPGARCASVYSTLEKRGIAVAGGRSNTVGIGGLVLGGGISYYSGTKGMVCDNVASFEVVLASGKIINANHTAHADLFQALKGGSNNFGIVTKIDMFAFERTNLWGGIVAYPSSTIPQHIKALVNFDTKKDPHASVIFMLAHDSTTKQTMVVNTYEYTKPVARAPIFNDFLAIQNISDSTRITNMTDLTVEIENSFAYRHMFVTLTFQNDERVLQKGAALFDAMVKKLTPKDEEWKFYTLFQHLPPIFAKHSAERGGNVLGLERFKTNNILLMGYLSWKTPASDIIFQRALHQLIADLSAFAKSIGRDNPFVYLNYADGAQDPLRSYGEENVRKMRAAAEKYDPEGVFQTMVPGGFKIPKVPRASGYAGRKRDEL